MYFDFNLNSGEQTDFISATLLPLWSQLASAEQAQAIVTSALPLLMEKGGLVSCTEESRGAISKSRPQNNGIIPMAGHRIK